MPVGVFQPAHLLIVLIVLLLVLVPGRLTGMGRALGQSWRALVAGFREGARERPAATLPARACPRCGVWGAEMARYCTRCGATLG